MNYQEFNKVWNENKDIFEETCNMSPRKLIEICEDFIKSVYPTSHLLREDNINCANRYFDISYSKINKHDWEPDSINYSLDFYDRIEIKINAVKVRLIEHMEHCSGTEMFALDFDKFYKMYVKNS